MFYDSVCLNDPHGKLIQFVVSRVLRHSHVTSPMKSLTDAPCTFL